MKLALSLTLTAALAAPLHAEEPTTVTLALAAPRQTSLMDGLKREAGLAAPAKAPAYDRTWQRRINGSRGGGGSTKRAVLFGALIGGAAGFVTGAAFEHRMCACGLGPVSALGTGIGAGGGAAVGLALSLR